MKHLLARGLAVVACLAMLSFGAQAASVQNAKKTVRVTRVVSAPAATATPAILYFADYTLGNDAFGNALTKLGLSYSFTNDPNAFSSQLAGSTWDLVICLQQNSAATSIFNTSLSNYVLAGGRAIYTDWYAANDPSLAAVFGGVPTGGFNYATLASVNGILFGAAALSNPGWGIYAVGYTTTGDGIVAARYDDGSAGIILANGRRTILNGTLQDSFADPAQGDAIAEGEIKLLLKKR